MEQAGFKSSRSIYFLLLPLDQGPFFTSCRPHSFFFPPLHFYSPKHPAKEKLLSPFAWGGCGDVQGQAGGIRGKEGEKAILDLHTCAKTQARSLTPAEFDTFNTAKPGPAGQRDGEHLLSALLSTERVKKPFDLPGFWQHIAGLPTGNYNNCGM